MKPLKALLALSCFPSWGSQVTPATICFTTVWGPVRRQVSRSGTAKSSNSMSEAGFAALNPTCALERVANALQNLRRARVASVQSQLQRRSTFAVGHARIRSVLQKQLHHVGVPALRRVHERSHVVVHDVHIDAHFEQLLHKGNFASGDGIAEHLAVVGALLFGRDRQARWQPLVKVA
jgi:hypothetical protein